MIMNSDGSENRNSRAWSLKLYAIPIAVVIVSVLIAMEFRSLSEAQKHLFLGEESQQFEQKIDHYRRSIAWNSPLNSASQEAAEKLTHLAFSTTAPRDRLEALRSLRRAFLSSRSFLTPYDRDEPQMREIDEEITRLEKAVLLMENRAEGVEEVHRPEVAPQKQILPQIAFWLWGVSLFALVWKGFTDEARVIARRLVPLALASTACFALWILALKMA